MFSVNRETDHYLSHTQSSCSMLKINKVQLDIARISTARPHFQSHFGLTHEIKDSRRDDGKKIFQTSQTCWNFKKGLKV